MMVTSSFLSYYSDVTVSIAIPRTPTSKARTWVGPWVGDVEMEIQGLYAASEYSSNPNTPRLYADAPDLPFDTSRGPRSRRSTRASARVAAAMSTLLRRLAKFMAVCNAIWIVLSCIFQFSSFFDGCWCNSSVLGRGKSGAYCVIDYQQSDIKGFTSTWIGGKYIFSLYKGRQMNLCMLQVYYARSALRFCLKVQCLLGPSKLHANSHLTT
jgi:hypothetical protein